MNSQVNGTEDAPDRPEGAMGVGSTSAALGGRKSGGTAAKPRSSSAPHAGSGAVGDGEHPGAERATDSGTSSTSIGTGSGGSNEP
jgi:hypothetical protein